VMALGRSRFFAFGSGWQVWGIFGALLRVTELCGSRRKRPESSQPLRGVEMKHLALPSCSPRRAVLIPAKYRDPRLLRNYSDFWNFSFEAPYDLV